VRVTTRRGEPWVTVPPMDKQPEPPTLQALKDEVERRWGTIEVPPQEPPVAGALRQCPQ